MDALLAWTIGNAGYAKIRAYAGAASQWAVVQGAWNEQHAYSVAKDFGTNFPEWWYMGDIPHGWAAAELILLVRDMLFFEADEDRDPHVYIAPGIPPHWLVGDQTISVRQAPSAFGTTFGYDLVHDAAARRVTVTIREPLPGHVHFVYPFRLGASARALSVDGQALQLPLQGADVPLPAHSKQL
jgi:hypothetical protein